MSLSKTFAVVLRGDRRREVRGQGARDKGKGEPDMVDASCSWETQVPSGCYKSQ